MILFLVKAFVLVVALIVFMIVAAITTAIAFNRLEQKRLKEKIKELGMEDDLQYTEIEDEANRNAYAWVDHILTKGIAGLGLTILMFVVFTSCSTIGHQRKVHDRRAAHHQRINGLSKTGHFKIVEVPAANTVRFRGVAGKYFFPTDSIPADSVVFITIVKRIP